MRSAPWDMKEYFVVAVHQQLAIRLIQGHLATNAKNVSPSGGNWAISLFS
jgi:hypothetical protein